MCGIIGCINEAEVATILVDGLKRMEYRGYDSAGAATLNDGNITIKKNTGRVEEIDKKESLSLLKGHIGIAHTRWATHGKVSQLNSHPISSCNGDIAVVHNGIIDNYLELKEMLEQKNHKIITETDTEVIPHILEIELETNSPKQAFINTVKRLKGSFAILAMFSSDEKTLYAVRKDAPLVIGVGVNQNFVASDILSFIQYTDRVMFLDNYELAEVNGDSCTIYGLDGVAINKEISQVAWEASEFSKEEFAHYTLKEIKEQPKIIHSTLSQNKLILEKVAEELSNPNNIYITAAGTSYHSCLIMKQLIATFLRKPSEAIISSEFSYHADLLNDNDVLLTISQSGETADVLSAVQEAKLRNTKIISLVNAPGSSLIRESDISIPLNCGPEIGVAATKSFTSQLAILYLIVLTMARDMINSDVLFDLEDLMGKIIDLDDQLKKLALDLKSCDDFYFIGRGLHYPISLEGALKLKELSYVHAEGFPAGELKHGTLALVEEKTPVFVINPSDDSYTNTLNNAAEMKARGATIIGVSDLPNQLYDIHIPLPKAQSLLYPIIEVIPLQFFAYHMAVVKQRNPDFPRNLAKSVTVK